MPTETHATGGAGNEVSQRFADANVIVTGAGQGIGQAVAEAFAIEGRR